MTSAVPSATTLPAWVVIPSGIDEDPPACRPEQMKIDDCLENLRRQIEEDKEEALFLAEVEEQERDEEEAFLAGLDNDESDSDAGQTMTTDVTDMTEEGSEEYNNEPRSQVIYEAHISVKKAAARFQTDLEDASIA